MNGKEILKHIDWRNRAPITLTKAEWSLWLGQKDGINLPVLLSRKNAKTRARFYHNLLHECCHVILEEDLLRNPIPDMTDFYLKREYNVESQVRAFCVKFGWEEIYKESLRWAELYRGHPIEDDRWIPYVYAGDNLAVT